VGGGIFVLILLYGYYHHERQKVINENLAIRKKEYFARLAELARLERAEYAEAERRETEEAAARKLQKAELKVQKVLQKAEEKAYQQRLKREQTRAARADYRIGRGAGAVGLLVPAVCDSPAPEFSIPPLQTSDASVSGSSAIVSSLHQSEMSFASYSGSIPDAAEDSEFSGFSRAGSGNWESEHGEPEGNGELHTPPIDDHRSEFSASEESDVSYFHFEDENVEFYE